ncbi:MAG TPA: alpha-hydroxy-acid oxidizing protein, partial [Bryobacteraceae bacterium]
AAGGAAGVARVVEILRTELEMTMGLIGCPQLSQISEKFLVESAGKSVSGAVFPASNEYDQN